MRPFRSPLRCPPKPAQASALSPARLLRRAALPLAFWLCAAGGAQASMPPASLCAGAAEIRVGACGEDGAIDGGILFTLEPRWMEAMVRHGGKAGPPAPQSGYIPRGGKGVAVVFIANPKLDARGRPNVVCDVEFFDPAHKLIATRYGTPCATEKPKHPGSKEMSTRMVFTIEPEKTDKVGDWVMVVTLHDLNTGKDAWLWLIYGVF